MTTTTTDAPTSSRTRMLGALPLIGQALRRLKIAEIVDDHAQPDPRMGVTHGQCVEAMIVAILLGVRPLYLVDQKLATCDLELGLGWSVDAARFHDQRLASALLKVGASGQAITDAAALRSIKAASLSTSVIHQDLTASGVYGRYSASRAPDDPESPDAIPHVTKGRSKDGRRGLKQIVYGVAVTADGAVPLVARASSGNRAEPLEHRFLMKRLAEVVPDPSKTTLVGDSKLCAGESLELARELGFDLVTLMPRSVGLWANLAKGFDDARREGRVRLLAERRNERDGVVDRWEGYSEAVTYRWKDEEKREREIGVRALVVQSTQLERAHRITFAEDRTKERAELEAALREAQRQTYACLEDAAAGARALVARLRPRFHRLTDLVKIEYVREKRAHRGRPKKDEPPPPTHEVHRAFFSVAEDDDAFEAAVVDASRFILLTTHPQDGPRGRTDALIFEAYNGQWKVERTMRALKETLKLAPIHLHDEARINGLARVYMLALMVHALIERDARHRLERLEAQIAGNLATTAKPTTEVAFRLFAGVSTLRMPGAETVRVVNLTTAQTAGYKRLGCDVLDRPGVVVEPPRPVEPGDRGYYRPRDHRRRQRSEV